MEEARCCFCGGGASACASGGGALLRFADKGKAGFAHELCALYSSGARVDLEALPDDYEVGCVAAQAASLFVGATVAGEVRRGQQICCALCGLRGATVGCYACSRRTFHFPCAARAGLVEWHWWESGHRARVCHCVEHLDAACDVRFGDDWHGAAACDGPHEGRYLFLYTKEPFGQEQLALNEHDVFCRPPPTGAAKWAAFARLNAACRETAPILSRLGGGGRKRRLAVRVVLDGGTPLDALGRGPPSVVAAAKKRQRVDVADRPLARPNLVTCAERAQSRAALVRADAGGPVRRRPRRAVLPPPRPCGALLFRASDVAFDVAATFLGLGDLDAAAAVCSAARRGVRAAEGRLHGALLAASYAGGPRAVAAGCYASPGDALRALDAAAYDWSCEATDAAGPGGTSLRATRVGELRRGGFRFAVVAKTGANSGDVSIAGRYLAPTARAHCFEVAVVTARPERPRAAVGVALGDRGLHRPSPFWLGREPLDGSAGRGLALDLATGLVHGTDLPTTELRGADGGPVRPEFPPRAVSYRVGVFLDLRSRRRIAFYVDGRLAGAADLDDDVGLALVRPAVALRDLGSKAVLRPAVPRFDDGDDGNGLPSTLSYPPLAASHQ